MKIIYYFTLFICFIVLDVHASIPAGLRQIHFNTSNAKFKKTNTHSSQKSITEKNREAYTESKFLASTIVQESKRYGRPEEPPLIFDLPVTYNAQVKKWINFYQSRGKKWFNRWLERAGKHIPLIQSKLEEAGLPRDLVYLAMIESGFSQSAVSQAQAVGPWQFIRSTANRYKLRTDWWIDERRDYEKSTDAAIRYLKALYQEFHSWYLVAASYNMGEFGVKRIIQRYKTNNYWELVRLNAFPKETSQYVPKLVAAMHIGKAPALYGFRDYEPEVPNSVESIWVPGGTDLIGLADYLGVTRDYLRNLNPELVRGFIPAFVRSHKINVPKGAKYLVSKYLSDHDDVLSVD